MSDETVTAKGPIAWMAQNSVAANLLMLLVIVGGIIMGMGVKQEIFPEFELDIVTVSVPYPGASPAEVEQGIILAIEEAVRGVDGVKKVTSSAAEGVGTVAAELLISAKPDKALQDIKNEVDRIQTFPEEAETPQVSLASRKSRVISLVIAGDVSRHALHGIAERARADLLARGDVTQVEVEGIPDLELAVEIPLATLEAYGLTLDDVAAQIGAGSLELPGGAVETPSGDVLVRVSDRALTTDEFGDIVLRGTADGAQVRLSDIATLRDGFADDKQETSFDGNPAVLITAYRVGSETPTGVADAVKAYAEDLRAGMPEGISVTVWDDDSELLRQRIDLLMRNGRTGLVLVFVVLALFLDLRLAFWVGLGIPISFAGAFLLFPGMGVSINMVSLFALIITLGLVVDDAIVVGENIYEKTEQGIPPLRAAIEGAQEMAMPVTFAILTTFAAFAPLLVVPGVAGKIFGIIPLVVITVLAFSLLEGFFVLPAHLGHVFRVPEPVRRVVYVIEAPRRFMSAGLARFIDEIYEPALAFVLHWRYPALGFGIALLILAAGARLTGLVEFSFLPKTEADIVKVTARLPYGAPIDATRRVSEELDRGLHEALAEVGGEGSTRGILTLLGQGEQQMGPAAGARPVGSHYVTIEADLPPSEERAFTTNELSRAWQAAVPALPGVESVSFVSTAGPGAGAAVDVQLAHPDTSVLAQASQDVDELLRTYGSLANVSNGYAAGKPQLDYEITPAGRTLGLTSMMVARQLRSAYYGAEALREQRGRNELKVMVRLPEADRASLYGLDRLQVRTPAGAWVPLDEVARPTRSRAATTINRDTGRRVVDVTAELAPGVKSAEKVLAELDEEHLPALMERYPGLSARFAGEQESQQEALGSLLKNFGLALFAIYALLAVPFKSYVQPIIIMSAIPFGIVGAIGGHLLMGFELSVISLMGIVALAGVVVNDSLVLIDAANGYRRKGATMPEAILRAGKRRFRPILLTSLTTFFGLVPMIFETSVQARFLIPMALSLGFGVLFATIIVLLLVPTIYVALEDAVTLFRWLYVDRDAWEKRAPIPTVAEILAEEESPTSPVG